MAATCWSKIVTEEVHGRTVHDVRLFMAAVVTSLIPKLIAEDAHGKRVEGVQHFTAAVLASLIQERQTKSTTC